MPAVNRPGFGLGDNAIHFKDKSKIPILPDSVYDSSSVGRVDEIAKETLNLPVEIIDRGGLSENQVQNEIVGPSLPGEGLENRVEVLTVAPFLARAIQFAKNVIFTKGFIAFVAFSVVSVIVYLWYTRRSIVSASPSAELSDQSLDSKKENLTDQVNMDLSKGMEPSSISYEQTQTHPEFVCTETQTDPQFIKPLSADFGESSEGPVRIFRHSNTDPAKVKLGAEYDFIPEMNSEEVEITTREILLKLMGDEEKELCQEIAYIGSDHRVRGIMNIPEGIEPEQIKRMDWEILSKSASFEVMEYLNSIVD